MKNKIKRGCNYTPPEKEILLGLVMKYQQIIENKETNARTILKKREAWNSLTRQYNAVATSGTRTWQQLRHLYENMKQRSKQKLAQEKRRRYDSEKLKIIKKKLGLASDDKRELICTGDGPSSSRLTDMDAHILAMATPQIQPLRNPYDDDAPFYFGGTQNECEEGIDDSTHGETILCDDAKVFVETQMETTNGDASPPLKREIINGTTRTATSGCMQLESEFNASKRCCTVNIEPDQELHDLKVQREKVLIEREKNMLEYEKELHNLQIEKLKLEIEILKKKSNEVIT